MRADRDGSVLKERHLVCAAQEQRTRREDDRGAAISQRGKAIADHCLGVRVHRAGGFIENQDIRISSQCRGECDALALTT